MFTKETLSTAGKNAIIYGAAAYYLDVYNPTAIAAYAAGVYATNKFAEHREIRDPYIKTIASIGVGIIASNVINSGLRLEKLAVVAAVALSFAAVLGCLGRRSVNPARVQSIGSSPPTPKHPGSALVPANFFNDPFQTPQRPGNHHTR